MAFQHQHTHGRVFSGILPRDANGIDNKLRFIHNHPGQTIDEKVDIIGADGEKHKIHKNGGLVHVHDASTAEKIDVLGDDGKKHVVHKNGGLVHVHDFANAQKDEVDGADGRKHVFNTNKGLGLVHDLGLSNKQEVDGPLGNKHLVHKNGGLVHVLGQVEQADKGAAVETVYSQVYVTESKTFAGPAVLSTQTGQATATTPTLNSAEAAYQSAKSAANAPDVVNSSSPVPSVATPAPTSTSASHSTGPLQHTRSGVNQLKGVPQPTAHSTASLVGGTPLSQSETGSPNVSSSKSGGMTPGASAGVAFGVLAALALVGGLFFFCWRRRKQQKDREGAEKLDEKHVSKNSFFGGTAAAVGHPAGDLRNSVQSSRSLTSHSAATAPRLSLRPVTQFLPNIIGGGNNNNNANGPQMSEKSKSGWDRAPTGASQNPFADAAVIDEKSARPVSPLNPFEEGDGAAAAANKSPSHSSKNSWEGSEPPTPKSTKFGTAAAVPIGAAGAAKGSPTPGPNNVHRVQLDFKPSMDDELGLKSGQLVRMLHEYDDGWVS